MRCRWGFGLDREQCSQVAQSEARALQLEPVPGEPHDRRRHPHRDEVEGDELTQRQGLRDDQMRSMPQQRGHHELAEEIARLLRGIRDALGPALGHGVGRELSIPAALLRRLDGQRLDGLDSDDRLREKTLVGLAAREPLAESRILQGGCRQCRQQLEEQCNQYNPGHLRGEIEEKGQKHPHEQEIGQRPDGSLHDVAAQLVRVAEASEVSTERSRHEVAERQFGQVPKEARGHIDVYSGGGATEESGSKPRSQGLEHRDSDERRENHVERVDAAVVDDLVDDEEERDRRGEREALQQQ